jgi:2-dehydro-3-deoxyphosphogluconate aldolase/(4S)-4-hydroxy-2-oxoglutarate aldolase
MLPAWRAGATALKLFPVPSCSVVRAMRAPLPDLALVAVGGVSEENLGEYLKSGCVAAGVGASVFAPGVPPAEIRQRVAGLVWVAQSATG